MTAPEEDTARRVLLALAGLLETEQRASLRGVATLVVRPSGAAIKHSTARYHLQRAAAQGLVELPDGRWFGLDLTPAGWVEVNRQRGLDEERSTA